MEVKSYIPQNQMLRNYIECFYTLTRRPEEKDDVYIAFPNVFTILCLNKRSRTEVVDKVRTLSHCPDNQLESNLICHFVNSEHIRYKGEADEICVYFKPLGINAFLGKELRHYVKTAFAEFDPYEDYRPAMTGIFSLESAVERVRAVEDYWLSKHFGFRHPFLPRIVAEMLENDGSFSLSDAARKIGISRTTLVKHFDRHLCTTPSHFKKIARFRSAMKQHRQKIRAANLTDISAHADYFDQSHMNKDFKSLTRHTPKSFFSKISQLENGRINWIFL